MIKSVTVINYLGEQAKIILEEEFPEHGLIIESISGLGPAKATVNTTSLANGDGSLFNSSRVEERNIVLSLILAQAKSIEDSRQRAYRLFPIKREITLVVETDNRTVCTTGYVESNEPDIFSSRESQSISILCPDPNFYKYGDEAIQKTTLSGVEPLFEFPFSNESLTEPMIEFGKIRDNRETTIVYEGDHEIGVNVTVHAIGPASNFMIYNSRTREIMRIHSDKLIELTGKDIGYGDDIIISTIRGNRKITLSRNGDVINILNCIERSTDWIRLLPGENLIAFTCDSGSENLYITIENRTVYEGV